MHECIEEEHDLLFTTKHKKVRFEIEAADEESVSYGSPRQVNWNWNFYATYIGSCRRQLQNNILRVELPTLQRAQSARHHSGMMTSMEMRAQYSRRTSSRAGLFDSLKRASILFRNERVSQIKERMESGFVSPSEEDDDQRSGKAVSGRASMSIMKLQERRKARKVRFYRNGDRFFKGITCAVSSDRFRTFQSLLSELTATSLCDKNVMPHGVRHIFTLDGLTKISSLDDLEDGASYVCASTHFFKPMDYPTSRDPTWGHGQDAPQRDGSPVSVSKCSFDDDRGYIKPKLITVIRNGAKPRKAVRVLLNRKTAHSYEQVLNDINDAIKMDGKSVKKVYTLDGKQMTCLQDFFGEESIYVAYGHEKSNDEDFSLDDNEVRLVSAYKPTPPKERITLKSPRAPRRVLSEKNLQEPAMELARRSPRMGRKSAPSSPAVTRRARSKSPSYSKLVNGHQNGSVTSPSNVGNGVKVMPMSVIEKYSVGKIIGRGNFAVVKTCQNKKTKKEFALKIVDKTKCAGKEQLIANEVSILRRMKHPNIVQLIEDFDSSSEMYLVMELEKCGDLFEAIATSKCYTERDAAGMLFNLMSAVSYLHNCNIVHRDIKPENLLVCDHEDGSKSLKLGDFGLATYVTKPIYVVCGTPTYVAPEVIAETGYGLPADIWSSGVITYILLCGFPPFASSSNSQSELFDKILNGDFGYPEPYWMDISDSAKDLISGMLVVDPEMRMTAQEVLLHSWVSDGVARNDDLHNSVTNQLEGSFRIRRAVSSPGVALLAKTALDKESRFFSGMKKLHLLEAAEEVF